MNPSIKIMLMAGPVAIGVGSAIAYASLADLGSRKAFASAPQTHVSEEARPDRAPLLLAQATDTEQSGLPGGASSLQESYQDWQVACASQGVAKHCAMSQQQADPQTRQRVLAIELNAGSSGKATGALVLPFGLALDAGVSIKVDEGVGEDGLRFRTCLPAGCVVALDLADTLVAAMREGTALHVTATPVETDQPVVFAVSLKGFSSALDRVTTLAR